MSFFDVEEPLARLDERFVREPLPPREWLRPGTLRPLLVVLAALLPFALAGPLRHLTSFPLWIALAVAVYVVGVTASLFGPALTARRPGGRLHLALGVATVGLVGGFACYVLYTRYFGGLTNFRGTDGSFHVYYMRIFVNEDPDIYQGFVSVYSAFYFAQRLFGCNVFWAFCVVFYAEVALVSSLPLVVTFSLLWPLGQTSRRAYFAGVLLAPLLAALFLYYAILPEQHLYQTDGFFPQLFGLLPLMALWLVDVLVVEAPLRVLVLLLALLLFRFTYGLNLGDAFIAVAALLLLDARDANLRRWFRTALAVLAVALVLVALVVYRDLWPLQRNVGHFLDYDVPMLCVGLALGLALLALVMLAARGARPLVDGTFARAARFPFAFGLVSVVVVVAFLRAHGEQRYYFYKYLFFALVLVGSACSAIVAAALPSLVARLRVTGWRATGWRAGAVAAAMLVLFAAATVKCRLAVDTHWRSYQERAWGKPPFNVNEDNLPLADLGAWKRIEKILADEKKRFGGYLISQFPMMMFTNAAFENPEFGWKLWFGGGWKSIGKPGTCMFWDQGTSRDWLVWESGFVPYNRRIRDELQYNREKKCQIYHAHWDPEGPPRILCHLCWESDSLRP